MKAFRRSMLELEDERSKKRELLMRFRLVLTGAFIASGVGFGAPAQANASMSPGVAAFIASHASFEQVGWRRYYGYPGAYAVPPVVVVPQAAPVAPPVVADQPAVVVVPPSRPASCGQYHYWNGQYCVDARYNRPYLGPRP